jgi:phosphoribosylamine--glycine ligase
VAASDDGDLITAGGRVLDVVGRGPDVPQARARAYEAISHLRWPGSFHRTDIASEVLT